MPDTSISYNMLNWSKPLTNTFHGVDSDSNSLGGTILNKKTTLCGLFI